MLLDKECSLCMVWMLYTRRPTLATYRALRAEYYAHGGYADQKCLLTLKIKQGPRPRSVRNPTPGRSKHADDKMDGAEAILYAVGIGGQWEYQF